MANGLLATVDITSANTDTLIYTTPASTNSVVSVIFCNRSSSVIKVRLYVGATVSASTAFVFDRSIPPGENYRESGIVLRAGQNINARANVLGINVIVTGYEDAA